MRHSMIKTLLRSFCLGGLLALVTACAKGPEDTPLELEIGKVVRDQIKNRWNRAEAPKPPVLTRALLDTIQDPHVEVVIEDADLRDYVTLQLAREDDLPGQLEVWRTVDNITFSFRDGMLVATRGLRGTMLSAQVAADGQGAMGPASGGQRRYKFRGDDEGSFQITLACELHELGTKTLEIVERFYSVRHVQEECTGPQGGQITNDYWIDSRSGRLWQSRQWAGPSIGYIRFRQVVI